VRRDEIQAKWVATQIALKRAIEKTGASKVITFHSRVNLAEDFAGEDARGFKEHVKGFDVFHVNGSQNAADRKALLEGFKEAPKGLITNARCLTEGVDVPAVDMVAFVDPRKSKIDIAQAAGRAMRQSKATNKKLGYIVVPLFIEQKKGETEAEAFTRSGFDEVAEVLGAMLESDDDLVDTIKEMQEARGRGDKFNPRQLHDKIEVIGPAINLEKLTESIDVEILDRLGVSWDRWLGMLQKFREKEGHCRVPQNFEQDGLKLGAWVGNIRQKNIRLTQAQVECLNALGFSWDPASEKWEIAFSALRKFRQKEGHCNVHASLKIEGVNLGSWVTFQRYNRKEITTERIHRLESLGFVWEPVDQKWEDAFTALRKFKESTGHCRVAQSAKAYGVNLGKWVNKQRLKKENLSPDRIRRLNEIGFSWNALEEKWELAFSALRKFYKREGHCRITQNLEISGVKLAPWASRQRKLKNKLSPDQIKRLDDLNFIWDPILDQWEHAFSALEEFKKNNGHCQVPDKTNIKGLKLGRWVISQRRTKNAMDPERIRRMDSLGFNWNPHSEKWQNGFNLLQDFKMREGHCNVPSDLIFKGFNLGSWTSAQRQNKRLSADRIKQLDSIGFCWDPLSNQWEDAFKALSLFQKEYGHCRVPLSSHGNSKKLYAWIVGQRSRKKSATDDQISRLNSIGFSWDPVSEQWDRAFSELNKFYVKEGHCRVPHYFVSGGVKLGRWIISLRRSKKLTKERVDRLNALGFLWKAR
jgi:hypothetical protein